MAKVSRAQLLPGSVHHGPASARVSLPPVFHLFASPGFGPVVRDRCSLLWAAGEVFQALALPPVSLLFYFPLGSGGIPVRLSETSPLSRVPRHRKGGMRGVRLKNLEIAGELYTSTLNERTRSCISSSCHSWIIMGHGYQLTNEGEESVEVLHMSVELP